MNNISIEYLKKKKKELFMTNEELAKLSGVPLGTVQKVMGTTTRNPRRDTVMALARVLAPEAIEGISYEYDPDSSGSGAVSEGAPALNYQKKQGEYTLEDYYAWPEDQRVELIDGVIYDMGAPLSRHQIIIGEVYHQLMTCAESHDVDCLPCLSPFDVQLNRDNRTMVQPDVVILCDLSVLIDRCIYGAPDFVLEVLSPSSRHRDQIIKLNKYHDAGVREYWIVDPDKERVTVYCFEDDAWPDVYSFDDDVPVRVSDGICSVDFSRIKARLRKLFPNGFDPNDAA